jgi:hypothetical protein
MRPALIALLLLVTASAFAGATADAERLFQESAAQGLDSFQKAGDPRNAANTRLNLGILYTAWTRHAETRAALELGLEEARRAPFVYYGR